MARLKSQDADGWRRFVSIYGPLVYSWGRATGLGEEDAADAGQEVFRSVAQSINRFRRDRPGDSFRGWLWTIARNRFRMHFRCLARQPKTVSVEKALEEIAELSENESENPEETVQLAERALEMIRVDFEPRTFQAFWRTAVDGQPASDVAQELGMSKAAVYMARSRVLARLRLELGEEPSNFR